MDGTAARRLLSGLCRFERRPYESTDDHRRVTGARAGGLPPRAVGGGRQQRRERRLVDANAAWRRHGAGERRLDRQVERAGAAGKPDQQVTAGVGGGGGGGARTPSPCSL